MQTTITAEDFETITTAISEGLAGVESSPSLSAGGCPMPDNFRTYYAELPDGRIARITARRDPAGRWLADSADVYAVAGAASFCPAMHCRGELADAIDSDPRL